MFNNRLRRKFANSYGKKPNIIYFNDGVESISSYSRHCRKSNPAAEYIDDTTWNDLSMDSVYTRINAGLSTSGEQYLYHMLRTPALDGGEFVRRTDFITLMESEPSLRVSIQCLLSKLGRRRQTDIVRTFASSTKESRLRLVGYIALSAALILSVCALMLGPSALLPTIALFIINTYIRGKALNSIGEELFAVNYSSMLIKTTKRLHKLNNPLLDKLLEQAYASGDRLKAAMRIGGVAFTNGNSLTELLCAGLLIDLISYEYLHGSFSANSKDIYTLHENIGLLDAAIAIASYRQSADVYTLPEIDFAKTERTNLELVDMSHPLIDGAVTNTVTLNGSALTTGSNASGKSTFLKAVALNVILSQSISTALCKSYRANAMFVMTSMALSDDIFAGESYYITEIRSLKRICDYASNGRPVLGVIDEILRGTNTIERISASSKLLESLAMPHTIILAATHDIELCSLLAGQYEQYHFTETLEDSKMTFDYKLRNGAASSSNAIKLLEIMGYPKQVV